MANPNNTPSQIVLTEFHEAMIITSSGFVTIMGDELTEKPILQLGGTDAFHVVQKSDELAIYEMKPSSDASVTHTVKLYLPRKNQLGRLHITTKVGAVVLNAVNLYEGELETATGDMRVLRCEAQDAMSLTSDTGSMLLADSAAGRWNVRTRGIMTAKNILGIMHCNFNAPQET